MTDRQPVDDDDAYYEYSWGEPPARSFARRALASAGRGTKRRLALQVDVGADHDLGVSR